MASSAGSTDLEIRQVAARLIQQKGDWAGTYTAQHIDECLDKEDFEGKRYWWRVMEAIKVLEDAEPGGARH